MDKPHLALPCIYLELVNELGFDPLWWSPVIEDTSEDTVQFKSSDVRDYHGEHSGEV